MIYLLLHGNIKRVKPTPEEIRTWESDVLEGLKITGGPSTPCWKQFRPDPEHFTIPFSVIIDPSDMSITAMGSTVDEEAIDALINK